MDVRVESRLTLHFKMRTTFHPFGHDLYDVGARGRLGTILIALLSHVTFLAKHTPRVNERAFCR